MFDNYFRMKKKGIFQSGNKSERCTCKYAPPPASVLPLPKLQTKFMNTKACQTCLKNATDADKSTHIRRLDVRCVRNYPMCPHTCDGSGHICVRICELMFVSVDCRTCFPLSPAIKCRKGISALK